MKKWLKDWWFSILMYVFAIAIMLFVVLGHIFLPDYDDYFSSLLIINSVTPVLLLFIIGEASKPKKEH